MSDIPSPETWVNTIEAAEITGYHPDYVRKLARANSRLPVEQRDFRVRVRSRRYDIWLSDFLKYVEAPGHGPLPRNK